MKMVVQFKNIEYHSKDLYQDDDIDSIDMISNKATYGRYYKRAEHLNEISKHEHYFLRKKLKEALK